MSERKTGHRGINGEWIEETPQAKLRNKLTPFWTLSSILSEERYDKSNTELIDMITRLSKTCEESKDLILKLIAETEK
jgi:hypothetical protein